MYIYYVYILATASIWMVIILMCIKNCRHDVYYIIQVPFVEDVTGNLFVAVVRIII